MSKYLLEIGVEELPYKFIASACTQLEDGFKKLFETQGLQYSSIYTYSTPRRLTVIVDGLVDKQPDITKSIKGPPAKVAFNEDGTLSQAGLGFLKKQGLSESDIEKVTENGVDYVFAKVLQKGQNTKDVLAQEVAALILRLQGAHFMRWADFDIKFSRPVRWIVSMMDNEEIKISIAEIESTRVSRGHRFAAQKEIEITSIDEYFEILKKVNVIANQDERKVLVQELLEAKAAEVGGAIIPDSELLDEIANIVEWPVPVLCSFSEDYLKVLDDVTVTVMKSHQRYFPVYKEGKLTNYFITMANFVGDEFENIRVGNERVIKARLDDGKFFYDEDLKKSLADRVEDLKGITFQKGLGTMYDKSLRLVKLAGNLANAFGLDSSKKVSVERSALLCKADLLTNLVYEFTELEGFIGADYALQSGESKEVAECIKEHYFPLGADSEVAQGIEGQIVGIVDKIDTIVTTFAVGKKPTGSADPLGIRRATLGVVTTILKNNLKVDVPAVIADAIALAPIEIADKDALAADICEFFVGRFKIMLQQSYKYDLVDAVCTVKNPLMDICDAKVRLDVLKSLSAQSDFAKVNDSINRIIRIIKDAKGGAVDASLFVADAEKSLFEALQAVVGQNLDYSALVTKLSGLEPSISKFFDDVLVNDPDEAIKQNRIALLASIKSEFEKIADFSKIVL